MSYWLRRGTPEDMPWMKEDLKKFSEFYDKSLGLFNDTPHADSILLGILTNHLVYICEREGHGPVGFICGYLSPHPFNQSIESLSEVFWWVQPEYRGTKAAALLLNAFMEYGEEHCDVVSFTLEEPSPANDRFLLKRGFKLKEKIYIKECI